MIGNLDNTLDGLVAKRSDVDPNSKRYQTESEAIELPDDETEMKVCCYQKSLNFRLI
jgi:hypothetical protein